MTLEILHFALVFFGFGPGAECAEVAALPRLRVDLSRIQPIFARLQFANHFRKPLNHSGLACALLFEPLSSGPLFPSFEPPSLLPRGDRPDHGCERWPSLDATKP